MINKVEICGVDTSKLPLLSTEEKKELLIKIKNGDKEARKKFINGNLRLVLSVIRRFFRKGENADDLFQVGCVGLIKAIDNFELEQNVQFSTYAVPMIIGEVKRYLRDNYSIRISRSIRDLAYKVIAEKERFLKQMGRALGTSIPSLETAESTLYEKVLAQLRGLSDAQLKLVSEYIGTLAGLPSPVLQEETPTTQRITLPVSEKFTS